jgi:hypothetical protein
LFGCDFVILASISTNTKRKVHSKRVGDWGFVLVFGLGLLKMFAHEGKQAYNLRHVQRSKDAKENVGYFRVVFGCVGGVVCWGRRPCAACDFAAGRGGYSVKQVPGIDAPLSGRAACACGDQVQGVGVTRAVWPFPPPGGPTPWTAAQKKAYEQQKREGAGEAPW